MDNAFMRAFINETGLDAVSAYDEWAAFSRNLSDAEIRRIESGGTRAGERKGREYNNFMD